MRSLSYSGNFYTDGNYRFTEPGIYEVDDAKAEQLLQDFPHQFTAVEGAQNDQNPSSPTSNLSKANSDQLKSFAAEIGLEITSEMDTNDKLRKAIKAHQSEV